MKPNELKAWRIAHADIHVPDTALEGMTDCASLYGSDYVVYLETKENEAAPFIRSMLRELVWVYGFWQKAQRDSVPALLLLDLFNAASGGQPEYVFVRKFIQDYMKANGIVDFTKGVQAGAFDFEKLPGVGEITGTPP